MYPGCKSYSERILCPDCNIPGYYKTSSFCYGKKFNMGWRRYIFLVKICWYLAAAVQIQLCKYLIEINDVERESTVWDKFNVLRHVIKFHLYKRLDSRRSMLQACDDGVWAAISNRKWATLRYQIPCVSWMWVYSSSGATTSRTHERDCSFDGSKTPPSWGPIVSVFSSHSFQEIRGSVPRRIISTVICEHVCSTSVATRYLMR